MSVMKYAAVKHSGAILALSAALALAAGPASAAPKEVSKSGDWTLYVDDGGGKTCYISSRRKSKSPPTLDWDAVFYVTRGASTNGLNVPSVIVSYTYQIDSQASVSIGSDTFTLFTDKDGAWIRESEDERKLVDAMKAGATMIVKGTSSRGNLTTDFFSLTGVSAGLTALAASCP